MARSAGPLSVYLHLPWCVRKCPYCDFNSHTAAGPNQHDDYITAMLEDIRRDAARADGLTVETVFIGGGTPSLFSPSEIGRILDALPASLSMGDNAEITMEANPGTVERGSMAGYRAAGVNRISLGAQSFDDAMLRRLGRIHSSADIRAAADEIRSAGFDSMNLDVMYALPAQSVEMALTDIRSALEIEPDHLSHYQLTLEPNTVFSARPPEGLPGDELAWDMQEACHELLAEHGLRQYEVSAFARPGQECRHNLNYWRFGEFLGIGAGAHGLIKNEEGDLIRSEKPANPRQYMESLARDGNELRLRRLSAEDAVFEYMLNVLRLPAPFTETEFEARTGQPAEVLRAAIEPALSRGLLAAAGPGKWQSTATGFRFLNDLQAMFLPATIS